MILLTALAAEAAFSFRPDQRYRITGKPHVSTHHKGRSVSESDVRLTRVIRSF